MATSTMEALPAALRQQRAEEPGPAAPRTRKRKRARLVFAALVVLAVLAALAFWLFTRGVETTDDAQLEGHVVNVAARVQGQVLRVLVRDNQEVKAGDVLVEIDPADIEARRRAAQADVSSAQAQLDAAQVQLELTERNANAGERQARGGLVAAQGGVQASRAALLQAQADVRAAQARRDLAATNLSRARQLRAQEVIAQGALDQSVAEDDEAAAALTQAQAKLANVRAGIAQSGGGLQEAQGKLAQASSVQQQIQAARAAVQQAQAKVQQAQAAAEQAELNLRYTRVVAPIDGIVSRRTVEPGQTVSPERPLLALVNLQDIWVVANFKEDQLGDMRPGQPARVKVDALGGKTFDAHVDTIGGATGARFALLPPDNATGNFIKVVQRVPVLLRFDGAVDPLLRPGLSVDVRVDVSAPGRPLTRPNPPAPQQNLAQPTAPPQHQNRAPQARDPR